MRIYRLISLAVCLWLGTMLANAQAAPSNSLQVKGLRAPVTVRQDERGIPYIEARDTHDLYLAQGYITARDRLWQMDFTRRTGRGELAEVLGRLALEEDKRRRTLGYSPVVEATWPLLKPASQAALLAYAEGVNAYLSTLTDSDLPAEFKVLGYRPRPWQPTDSLIVGKLFAEFLSTTWQTDLLRAAFADLPAEKKVLLFSEYSPLDVLVVGSDDKKPAPKPVNKKTKTARTALQTDRAMAVWASVQDDLARQTLSLEQVGFSPELRQASNNWVVSGKRTASGKPLLANDPHLRATAPNIWHMAHLTAPDLRAAGVVAPGVPGILLGHNDRIAWGATNLGPDVQDLYIEKFDPQNPNRYQTPGGWRDAVIRREEIKIRSGFTSAETVTETLEVKVTRHGPILLQRDGINYALQWTALTPRAGEFEGFFEVQTAKNWDEFTKALAQYAGPTQNFIYADVAGNIGYYGAGAIPIRKSGDGSVPYDGATDAGEWVGLIPANELPRSYNPSSGLIVTANSRVVGQDYPHFLTHEWFAPVRARRIYELLTAKQKLTADDMLAVQGDITSISGRTFAGEVINLASAPDAPAGDAAWQGFVKTLQDWDGRMAADSTAALLVNETRMVFRRRMLESILGPERAAKFTFWASDANMTDYLIAARPAAYLPAKFKNYTALLQDCLTEARANLTKRLGTDESKWLWGVETQVRFFHPLAQLPLVGQQFLVAPFPQNGSGFTLATPNVGAGVSMRHVSEPGNWDKTRFGIGLGISGDARNPHWQDQLSDWRNTTPRTFPFTAAAVAQAARATTTLQPTP